MLDPPSNRCKECGGTGKINGEFHTLCLGTGYIVGEALRAFLKMFYDDTIDKLDDIKKKVNKIKEKVDEIKEVVDAL